MEASARQNCTKCGRTEEERDALHACNQIDCPIRASRRASLRQLAFFVTAGLGVLGLSVGGLYFLLASPAPVGTAVKETPAAVTTARSLPAADDADAVRRRAFAQRSAARDEVLRTRELRRLAFARLDPAMFHPSFDCQSARVASLQAICGDAELAILDRNTRLMFAQALAVSPDPEALQRRRIAWEKERARLPSDRNTLLDFYESWVAELNAPAPVQHPA